MRRYREVETERCAERHLWHRARAHALVPLELTARIDPPELPAYGRLLRSGDFAAHEVAWVLTGPPPLSPVNAAQLAIVRSRHSA